MRATDRLDVYLARERSNPFEWSSQGNGDCLLFLLGWAEQLGFHPSVAWRGSYSCEQSARLALDHFGGQVVAITDAIGAPRMGSLPERGDVGIMRVRSRTFGAICTGRMWAFRAAEGGVGYCELPVDVCWNTRFLR